MRSSINISVRIDWTVWNVDGSPLNRSPFTVNVCGPIGLLISIPTHTILVELSSSIHVFGGLSNLKRAEHECFHGKSCLAADKSANQLRTLNAKNKCAIKVTATSIFKGSEK